MIKEEDLIIYQWKTGEYDEITKMQIAHAPTGCVVEGAATDEEQLKKDLIDKLKIKVEGKNVRVKIL